MRIPRRRKREAVRVESNMDAEEKAVKAALSGAGPRLVGCKYSVEMIFDNIPSKLVVLQMSIYSDGSEKVVDEIEYIPRRKG
jgi:hypothetical protein